VGSLPRITSEKATPEKTAPAGSPQNNAAPKTAGGATPSTKLSSGQPPDSTVPKNSEPSGTTPSIPTINTSLAKTTQPVRTSTAPSNATENSPDNASITPTAQLAVPAPNKNIPVSSLPKVGSEKVTPEKTPPSAVKTVPLESLKTQDRKDGADGQALQVPQQAVAEPVSLESATVTMKAPSEEIALTKVYRVGPTDVLDIRLNDSSTPKSTLFTVTATGLLEHPMLAEPLSVAGLTVEEIATKLEDDLAKRALIENPKAMVAVRDYASHTILVSGLVKDSGTRILRREAIPLYVVVADAQPLPEAARVTVVRDESNQIFEVDLAQASAMNLLVHPGDVVTLQPAETQFIYIGGEVKSPGERTFRRGLTLTQAIITAGGIGPKSKFAEIGRDDGRGFLVGTRFNLLDIGSGKTADPLLKPGDRIVILH